MVLHWDKLVLASNNAGKLKELRALFKLSAIKLIPQTELGVPDTEETGSTFVENALMKARHASRLTKLPALADDSGLVVNALKGAPGIHSARFAGVGASNEENIAKLLNALKDVPEAERHAYFYCVIVVLSHAQDPTPIICEGKWEGKILTAPSGTGGFGYDPIFFVPDKQKSAAELPIEIKNSISHRGKALQLLLKKI